MYLYTVEALSTTLKRNTMKKKPIFTVSFFGNGNAMCQPVKATDETEARTKFLKRFPKVSDESITDISLLESDHKHFRILASGAI